MEQFAGSFDRAPYLTREIVAKVIPDVSPNEQPGWV